MREYIKHIKEMITTRSGHIVLELSSRNGILDDTISV